MGHYLIGLVNYILYAALLLIMVRVIFLFMGSELKIRITHHRYRRLNKNIIISKLDEKQRKKPLYKHIYQLMAIRTSEVSSTVIYAFIITEILLTIGVFVILFIRIEDIIIALLCALLSMSIPYLYLVVRARNIQTEVGQKLQELVETIIHTYSATNDMYTALNATHEQLENKELKKLLLRLISDLQTVHHENDVRKVIELFIYTTGSSWGMRLGNVILKGYVHQENVTTALLTLQKQMITHQKMLEEEKSGAVDVFAQAMLAVVLLPVSLLGAKYVTQPQNWWHLQFGFSWTLISFIVTILFVGISVIVGILVKKPKNDL